MPDFTDLLKPANPQGFDTLRKERAQSTIPVQELANHLLSEDGFLERQRRILPLLENDPLFCKEKQQNLSRPERYHLGLARAKKLRRMTDRLNWDYEDYKMAEYLVDDVSPYNLHHMMFLTTIREQASDEQRRKWLPIAEKFQIIGAYAQTELGHGSNVSGLEVEARWDPASKTFILHSPTITASKWWNGSMGRTANHAVVVAQLLIPEKASINTNIAKYKSCGTHTFIVQIRDMKTHHPLPGVVIGDIGPKYGYQSMDNGYMLFNQFRVPYSALLSRYASLDPESGTFTKPQNSGVVYGSMTYMRSNIVMHSRLILARAVTVAVRYLSIRKQFRDRDGPSNGPELSVLDYPTVQIRILPLLATTFALHYTGLAMKKQYQKTRAEIDRGDFKKLGNLHSNSSGLKSLCTTLAGDGIETVRRALGGHGYGGGSGLIQLNNDYLSRLTIEGDNWMITQQVASFLIKKTSTLLSLPSNSNLDDTDLSLQMHITDKDLPGKEYDVLHHDIDIVRAFQRRAASLIFEAYDARIRLQKPWNSLLIHCHKLSRAHSQSLVISNFYMALENESSIPTAARRVMRDCFRLFAFHIIECESYEFYKTNAVTREQLAEIPHVIQSIMTSIRPHAVALVDSWAIPDYLLDSALGRYDGKVYEDLFNRAHRLNPLNRVTFNPNYWEEEIIMGSKGSGDLDFLSKL